MIEISIINEYKKIINLINKVKVSENTTIYVKSEKEQNWILNLNSSNRPSSWTIDNVLIAE